MKIEERLEKWGSQVKQFFKELFDGKNLVEESIIEEANVTEFGVDPNYLNRFEAFSLQDNKQLKGRENSQLLLEKAYNGWKENNNPLLVVSETGLGTSSLLHSTINLYPEAILLEDDVNFFSESQLLSLLQNCLGIEGDYQSFDELAKRVKKNQVVIFENIERLFLRTINGFNILEDFILFVHQTKSSVYWLLTINRYSYYYLNRVRDFSSNFGSILFLKPVSNETITEIIEERNQGYDVIFLPLKNTKLPKNFKSLTSEEKQKLLKDEFSKKLLNFAEGNISRALLYWRKSVFRTKGQTIYIRAFEPRELSDLSLDEIMILEAIMQHSSLSVEELKIVSRSSSKGSKLAIEKLMEKDAIIFKQFKNTTTEEYQINPLYMAAVKSLFRNRLNRNFV